MLMSLVYDKCRLWRRIVCTIKATAVVWGLVVQILPLLRAINSMSSTISRCLRRSLVTTLVLRSAIDSFFVFALVLVAFAALVFLSAFFQ